MAAKSQPAQGGVNNTRTTTIDNWEDYQIKTIDDLFNYEAESDRKLAQLDLQLHNEKSTKKKSLIKKAIEDEKTKRKALIEDLYLNEEKRFKKQQKNKQKAYAEEIAYYKSQLKTLVAAGKISQKDADKQTEKLKKAKNTQTRTQEIEAETEGARALKQAKKAQRDAILEGSKDKIGGVGTLTEQIKASFSKVGENLGKKIGEGFKEIGNKINSMIDTYSKYQSSIDTRLQETGQTFTALQSNLKKQVGASPYLKTETMLTNLQTLVELGISTNVDQRAFLMTIKDKIATTFDANNAALLRIIRLQQNDSTAARLGMEAYLTRFLNNMVDNTEYLNSTFDSVAEALIEASSQMNTAASTEFEYIVQKWLGTLTGTGLAEATATSIASALGKLGSGNVSALSSDSMNNLLVMAASKAGLSYADLLTNGLSATDTNKLMYSLVQYMQEIGSSSSNVVRSQYAQVFGLNVSDLTAASQLADDMESIYSNLLSYSGMYEELSYQMDQVSTRTSFAEKINNLFDNAQFSLASNIAGSAAMSAMWKVTDMIQSVTGGINIPALSAFGTGIDLETTVENLMKLGLVGVGSLGMIGDVVTGLSNSGGNFSNILNRLGITSTNAEIKTTGKGLSSRSKGMTTSITSSVIGNSSGEDIEQTTLNQANDEANQQLAEAKAEDTTSKLLPNIHDYLLGPFDSKMDSIIEMIAKSNGYTVSSITNSNIENILNNVSSSIEGKEYKLSGDDRIITTKSIDFGKGSSVSSMLPDIISSLEYIPGIYRYLTQSMNDTFNSLLRVVAISSGYSVEEGEDTSPSLLSLDMTNIKTLNVSSETEDKTSEFISTMRDDVHNIYEILANGSIKVELNNFSTTTTSSGF